MSTVRKHTVEEIRCATPRSTRRFLVRKWASDGKSFEPVGSFDAGKDISFALSAAIACAEEHGGTVHWVTETDLPMASARGSWLPAGVEW